MKEINKINVWYEDGEEWVDYDIDEMEDYFNTCNKVDWKNVKKVYFRNSHYDVWLEVVYINETTAIYNKVFGTFIKQ